MSWVADVLVLLNTPLLLEYTSYSMMTPLGSEGGLHEMVSCIPLLRWLTDQSQTLDQELYRNTLTFTLHATIHSPSCSVSTVRAILYGPVPPALIAATWTE